MTPRLAESRATLPHAQAVLAASGGLLAATVTAVACVGPLVAILLGVGGFGWLTQYAFLRVPASIVTAALLLLGFRSCYGASSRFKSCPNNSTRRRLARGMLWFATVFAIAVNVFEYVVFPRLG